MTPTNKNTPQGKDTWGKVLLLCSTALLIAPCMLVGLFHLAHQQGLVHRPEFTGLEAAASNGDDHSSVLAHPMSSHYGKAERRDQMAAHLVGNEGQQEQLQRTCLHSGKEAATVLPPLLHEESHHIAILIGVWCLFGAFHSPSHCRGRLGLALVVALVISFPLPLMALMRHAEASEGYCTAKATTHVSTTLLMSVSLGPFQAISVVQHPTVTTVNAEELASCMDTIERRVRFIGTVFWSVFGILFCAAGAMSMSDMALPSEADENELVATGSTITIETAAKVASPSFSLKKKEAVMYVTVPAMEVEYV